MTFYTNHRTILLEQTDTFSPPIWRVRYIQRDSKITRHAKLQEQTQTEQSSQ